MAIYKRGDSPRYEFVFKGWRATIVQPPQQDA
jgi:hypothetical protein